MTLGPLLPSLWRGVLASLLTIGIAAAGASRSHAGKDLGDLDVQTTPIEAWVEVFDANPSILAHESIRKMVYRSDGKPRARVSDTTPEPGIYALTYDDTVLGAVADGESRLLLRIRTNVPGYVQVEVDKGEVEIFADGSLFQESDDDEDYYALALYTPPEIFPDPAENDDLVDGHHGLFMGRAMSEGLDTVSLDHREVHVTVRWLEYETPIYDATTFLLLRPPVVLVHGTYDNARDCWNWPQGNDPYWTNAPREYQPRHNFTRQLEDLGFMIFLVNYADSNGTNTRWGNPFDDNAPPISDDPSGVTPRIASHFRDNQLVLWYGGRMDSFNRGEGIGTALDYYRDTLKFAITQVDAIGHSMGGVLIRAYAHGKSLPDNLHAGREQITHSSPWAKDNWYLRLDNFQRGDINRLITIGTTHQGSHIPGTLRNYPRIPKDVAGMGDYDGKVWRWGNWLAGGQFAPGAFTDQIPMRRSNQGALRESAAYPALGPTKIPAHAIAGVAKVPDMAKFPNIEFHIANPKHGLAGGTAGVYDVFNEGIYRMRLKKFWVLTPETFFRPLFSRYLNQPEDGEELLRILDEANRKRKEVDDLLSRNPIGGISVDDARERSEKAAKLTKERLALLEWGRLRYLSAAFGNDWTDVTVSLGSSLGGLPERSPYTTVVPPHFRSRESGVLHGFEPRYGFVIAKVKDLLLGSLDEFNPEGFPKPRPPRYVHPKNSEFLRYLRDFCRRNPVGSPPRKKPADPLIIGCMLPTPKSVAEADE